MVFKKGSLIAISKPFAYAIADSERDKRCEACLELNKDLHRCKQCQIAKYCNKKCQTQGWILHKLECKHLKKVNPKVPPETTRMMALIILKLKKDGNNEEEKIANVTRKYSCLVNHVEDMKMDKVRYDQWSVLCYLLDEYLGRDLLPPLPELLTHFGKMAANSFSITDGEQRPIGVGTYLGASGLDHSCKPNANAVFYGPDMHIRALEDIDHSDITKIFLSYIDVFDTTSVRREALRKQYYFICNCALCNDHDRDVSLNYARCGNKLCTKSIDPGAGKKLCSCGKEMDADATKKVFAAVENFLENNTFKETESKTKHEERLAKCKTLLRDCSFYLHPLNFRLVRLWDLATDTCVMLQMWALALEYTKNTLPAYRLYYGNTHQSLGIQLFKIAKIQLELKDFHGTARTLAESSRIIRLTHGEFHPTYRLLQVVSAKCFEMISQ